MTNAGISVAHPSGSATPISCHADFGARAPFESTIQPTMVTSQRYADQRTQAQRIATMLGGTLQ